jgi:hypothetical protein
MHARRDVRHAHHDATMIPALVIALMVLAVVLYDNERAARP